MQKMAYQLLHNLMTVPPQRFLIHEVSKVSKDVVLVSMGPKEISH